MVFSDLKIRFGMNARWEPPAERATPNVRRNHTNLSSAWLVLLKPDGFIQCVNFQEKVEAGTCMQGDGKVDGGHRDMFDVKKVITRGFFLFFLFSMPPTL